MKKLALLAAASAALAATACSDSSTTGLSNQLAASLTSTFSSTPAGFSSLTTSYVSDSSAPPFMPAFGHDGRGGAGGPGRGFGPPPAGPGIGLGLMGGGLDGFFFGDGFGPGFDHGPRDGRGPDGPGSANCAFDSGTGLVTCTTTHDGITVTQTTKYTTASGTVESTRDSLTNTIATNISISGTATRRDSSTSTVSASSSQTVTGLAANGNRTYNGTSGGTEQSTGTWHDTTFSATRVVGDTVTGVVIPAPSNAGPTYPTAGTIIRSMSATVTVSGQAAATSTRREVITYNGTNTATVVITMNDSTQSCTLPLPHGRLACQ